MKAFLVLALLVSALLAALASHQQHPATEASHSRVLTPTQHPLRIVRSPQAPKIVRPVHPSAEPAGSPAHPLARPLGHQHKA